MSVKVESFYVTARVLKDCEISEPDDESLPGCYEIELTLHSDLVQLLNASTPDVYARSAVACAVLDCFHEHQGVEDLDPFDFTVEDSSGVEFVEVEVPDSLPNVSFGTLSSLDLAAGVISASFLGRVDEDDEEFDLGSDAGGVHP